MPAVVSPWFVTFLMSRAKLFAVNLLISAEYGDTQVPESTCCHICMCAAIRLVKSLTRSVHLRCSSSTRFIRITAFAIRLRLNTHVSEFDFSLRLVLQRCRVRRGETRGRKAC